MKATVDKDLCIGCELCVQLCSSVFTMGTDGFAEAITGPLSADSEACCKEAAESCPVSAITVAD
jgi:ferredoxin